MPLSPPTAGRTLLHARKIELNVYKRTDGCMDLDARLIDTKPHDIFVGDKTLLEGAHLHDITLRVTIDSWLNVVAVEAQYDAAPYDAVCQRIETAYTKLVGLNLLNRFRDNLRERLGRTLGCSHLNELGQLLPTVALQAYGGSEPEKTADMMLNQKPFHLDSCHALRTDGEVVMKYYPKWYVSNLTSSDS